MKQRLICAVTTALAMAVCIAPAAHGTEARILLADARMAGNARFIALDSVREGRAGLRIAAPTGGQAGRSDRAALQSGFMRLDRDRIGTVRIRRTAPRKVETAAPVPVIRGPDDDVLALFGETDRASADAAPPGAVPGSKRHAWPLPAGVEQRISSHYGYRSDPFTGRRAFHGGVDIAAASGTPVLASAEGVVEHTGGGGKLGNYVVLRHADGTQSTYGHLRAQAVHEGQHVRQGQKLGELGSTGRSTGPHLDYRIRKDGAGFDPMLVLAAPVGMGGVRVASAAENAPEFAPSRRAAQRHKLIRVQ